MCPAAYNIQMIYRKEQLLVQSPSTLSRMFWPGYVNSILPSRLTSPHKRIVVLPRELSIDFTVCDQVRHWVGMYEMHENSLASGKGHPLLFTSGTSCVHLLLGQSPWFAVSQVVVSVARQVLPSAAADLPYSPLCPLIPIASPARHDSAHN